MAALSIAARLRKAREMVVTVGGFEFMVRRPTDIEMVDLRGGEIAGEQLLRFLFGWKGVKESDILGDNADPHEVPFNAETAREWLADRPDLYVQITTGLLTAYREHAEELEARLKNSTPGSNPPPPDSIQDRSPTTSG